MNPITKFNVSRSGLSLPLLLCTALTASATVQVTFQVDMSTAPFDPNSQTVAARGTFNGWAAFPLTNNPAGTNPSLWSGTTNIPGNGTVLQYKYTIEPGATYETVAEGGSHNRLLTLPADDGSIVTLPQVYFADSPPTPITVSVTFQVDMAQQVSTGAFDPNSSSVYAPGFFNSWNTTSEPMTNDPTILRTNSNGLVTSNVYVNTYDITGSPGQTTDFKYYIDTGSNWESPPAGTGDPQDNNNRFFNLGSGATQTLPVVYFNDQPYAPVATNDVTFQVDMSVMVLQGHFDPTTDTVELRGNFNSWGNPQILCTNNPAGANTNLYRTVVTLKDGVGATEQYKFWASGATMPNSGWETMANNRTVHIINGTAQALPVVYFSDLSPSDFLSVPTTVTFSVDMNNAVGTDGATFNPATDQVYLNGVPSGFGSWDTTLPMLTNNPVGSKIYSIDMLLPAGSPVQQTYKYGINGVDDEAPSGDNHIRYVRTTGTYSMPLDTFGKQYQEPSFGELTAGLPTGSTVPISWLGRPGVFLQTTKLVTDSVWQDLTNTDGSSWSNGYASTNGFISVTNWPAADAQSYFRLIKP